MHNNNKERSKQGKEEGMGEGRRGGGNKKKKEGRQRLSDRSVHVKYYIDHLAYTCVHILCVCTQFHARKQRVSEYTHEYLYVYFQFVYVFCVCGCVSCMCNVSVVARVCVFVAV